MGFLGRDLGIWVELVGGGIITNNRARVLLTLFGASHLVSHRAPAIRRVQIKAVVTSILVPQLLKAIPFAPTSCHNPQP